jgi:hypothetical protein
MSRPAWVGKRRDETEPAIVRALEDIGAEVERLDRPFDLLVWFRGRLYPLECTGITEYRKRDADQAALLERWGIPTVRTPIEALRAVGAMT